MKAKIQIALISFFAIFLAVLLLSQNANPDMPQLFGLKRLQEKVYFKLEGSSEGKYKYMMTLLDKRLGEIENILNNKSYDYLLSSSLRYSTLAGQITEASLLDPAFDKAAIKEKFEKHKKIFNELYIAYPKNTSNLEYKYLEDDINYLNLYLDKLSSN